MLMQVVRRKIFILRNAKADWNIAKWKVVIGLQGMNMFKIQEMNWGKRYLR